MIDLRLGDAKEILGQLEDNSIDSIVTDPPYGLKFMNKKWDYDIPSVELWGECLRVLKPGGHLLSFGGARTYHRMVVAIEDAGFEIRDSIHWIYGSGFPKSLNIGKAIDKAAGAKRKVLGEGAAACEWIRRGEECQGHGDAGVRQSGPTVHAPATAPATDEAKRWEGWGTALKPAHEPIVVARKPLVGTVAANVLEHGTGGLNIDDSRIGPPSEVKPQVRATTDSGGASWGKGDHVPFHYPTGGGGRWPANVVFDEAAGAALDQQSGVSSSQQRTGARTGKTAERYGAFAGQQEVTMGHADSGGASRFFTQADWGLEDWPFVYQAKPSRRERNAGLDELPSISAGEATGGRAEGSDGLNSPRAGAGRTGNTKNHHPTVKPVALMRHLVRLVTPPEGVVLDPFLGSGTTGIAAVLEGFNFVGIEVEQDYLDIAELRISHWESQG